MVKIHHIGRILDSTVRARNILRLLDEDSTGLTRGLVPIKVLLLIVLVMLTTSSTGSLI